MCCVRGSKGLAGRPRALVFTVKMLEKFPAGTACLGRSPELPRDVCGQPRPRRTLWQSVRGLNVGMRAVSCEGVAHVVTCNM